MMAMAVWCAFFGSVESFDATARASSACMEQAFINILSPVTASRDVFPCAERKGMRDEMQRSEWLVLLHSCLTTGSTAASGGNGAALGWSDCINRFLCGFVLEEPVKRGGKNDDDKDDGEGESAVGAEF